MDPSANSGPPGPPFGPPDPSLIPSIPSAAAQSVANACAGVSVALNIVSFMVFSGRVWTKSFPVFHMGTDDYIISVAYALLFANSVLLLLPIPYAFGGDPNTITMQEVINGNRYATIAQPLWVWSMATIKISVATMLLRLEQKRILRQLLWTMIGLQVVVGIYTTVSALTQCIPFHATWDIMGLITDKKCWSTEAIRISSICVSSFHTVTDIIFALLPATFLKKVQMPLRDRVVIGVLMGLGIFASAASIVKAVVSSQLGKSGDFNKEVITIGTWSVIEEQVAFIAACIPCLRKPFQSLLRRFGISSSGGTNPTKSTGGSGFKRMYGDHTAVSGEANNGNIHMKSMALASRDDRSEENILSGHSDSLKPGEIWRTTEVHLEEEEAWSDSSKPRETFRGNPG